MIDNDLLRQEKLTGMVQEFKPEALDFMASGILPVENVQGLVHTWDVEVNPRGITGLVGDHSPAKPLGLNGIKQQTAKLGLIRLSKNLPASLFRSIRQPGSEAEQRNASQQIAREEREFAALMDRTEEFLIASALHGSISTTVDDLEIAAIDYGIPAGNKFVYNSGTAELNCGDWLDESADVIGALRRMKKAVRQGTGYRLETAWVSDLVQEALLKNDQVVRVLKSTEAGRVALEEGRIGRLMGINFREVDHTYKVGSTVTRYLPQHIMVVTPAPSRDWGFMGRGTLFVPNDARDGFVEVGGRSSYAEVQVNPPGLTLYANEATLPVIRKPGVLVHATVTAA